MPNREAYWLEPKTMEAAMGFSRRMLRVTAISTTVAALVLVGATAPADARVRRDPCLTGTWKMGPAQSLALLRELANVPGFTVTRGTITLTFGGGEMTYGSTLFILTGTTGDTTFSAEASFITEAPYRTRNGKIRTGPGTYEINYGDMTATTDGETHTVPGPPGRTEPTGAGSTPYTCNRTTLHYAVPTATGGRTDATFRRA